MDWQIAGMHANFHRCALVGGGSVLSDAKHGPDIDSHDIVIRVNRLPTPATEADVGNRTDIFLVNHFAMGNGLIQRNGGSYVDSTVDNDLKEIGLFLFKPLNATFGRSRVHERWFTDEISVGLVQDHIWELARSLSPKLPTTGFLGFLTFAPICRSLTLFGFGGKGNLDGHESEKLHGYTEEHKLIAHLITGTLPDELWAKEHLRPSGWDKWLQRQFLSKVGQIVAVDFDTGAVTV